LILLLKKLTRRKEMASDKLLKDSVDNILSFDAEMFPNLLHSVHTVALRVLRHTGVVIEDMDKEALDALQTRIVQLVREELAHKLGSTPLSLFTSTEKEEIKSKVKAYQSNNSSREGGAYLIKELQLVHNFKEGLSTHLGNIKEALKPREATRVTVKEAEALATERSIKNVALTLKGQNEKFLRQMGQMFLGDSQFDFTPDELPMVIATMQIAGVLLQPGKVS